MEVIFQTYIREIRTGNPSLAVKVMNVTPRPILPGQKSDNHSMEWKEKKAEKEIENKKS